MLKVTSDRKPYLEHLALLLENESAFYASYTTMTRGDNARNAIRSFETRQRSKDEQTRLMGGCTVADEREILRRYFNEKWDRTQGPVGSRGSDEAPFKLYEDDSPKPVKPGPFIDWHSLPDGTVLITKGGARYIKGNRPPSNVQGFPELLKGKTLGTADRPVVGYQLYQDGSWQGWQSWHGDGTTSTGDSDWRLVSYELLTVQTPELATDWASLPDGTVLITKGGNRYIKGSVFASHSSTRISMQIAEKSGYVAGASPGGSWNRWNKDGNPCDKDGRAYSSGDSSRLASYELPKPTNADNHIGDSIYQTMAAQFKATQPKEITMNSIITITTKTLINGQDIAMMSNAALYDVIAQQEKKIAELDAIKNKPKALKKELAERQAGIDALVAHLDSRDDSAAK